MRELKNVIERAAILSDGDEIDTDCVLFSFEIGKGNGTLKTQLPYREGAQALQSLIDLYERQIIKQALEKANSIRKTAKTLGL